MPLRIIPAILMTLFFLSVCLKNSRNGLFLLILSIFLNPGSFFWGIDKFHIPMLFGTASALAAFREKRFITTIYPPPVQNKLIFLFLIFLLLSALFGSVPDRTYPQLENWTKLFILYILVQKVITTRSDLRMLWIVILGAICLLTLRGYYQYHAGYDELMGAPNTTMGDRNTFAMTLAMALPFTNYFFQTEKKIRRYAFFFTQILIIGLIILTYSRMGFLLVLIFLISMLFTVKNKILFVMLLIPLSFLTVSFAPDSWVKRINTIQTYEEDASAMGRIEGWNTGIRMMEENPIFGVGLNSFEVPSVYSRYAKNDHPLVAHNSYVQTGAEAGIPALLLYLMILTTSFFSLIRTRRRFLDPEWKMLCDAMLVSLLLYCCASILLSVEDNEFLYILIGSITGFSVLARRQEGEKLVIENM